MLDVDVYTCVLDVDVYTCVLDVDVYTCVLDVDVFAEVYGPNSKCIDTEIDSPWSFMGNATDPIESGACYQVSSVNTFSQRMKYKMKYNMLYIRM